MSNSISQAAGADLRNTRRKKAVQTGLSDRLPPHSEEGEQGIIGCILLSPRDCLGICITKFNGMDVFYDLRHQIIYNELVAMYDNNEAIDIITVHQRLKDRQLLEQVGGIPYLNSCQDAVPSAANLEYYIDFVVEKAQFRRLIKTCTDVVGRVYDFQGDANELFDAVERDILAISSVREATGPVLARSFVDDGITSIEQMFTNQGAPTGLTTGFSDLDRMTNGLHNGNMIVIAARPSMGKTSLAMNIAEHVALQLRLPVGVFSLEMTGAELMTRAMCSNARLNLRRVRDGIMTEEDFPRLTNSAGAFRAAQLYIDDTGGLSILQLRARARRLHQQHGIRLLVIDYLQLLHSDSPRGKENRQQEVSDISSGIKELAKELNVPVVVLSQLNRELEKTPNRKPRLSDLRESGSIEQDADFVGLLYKPDHDEEAASQEEADAGCAVNLLIAKQRNGPTGDVHLTFLKQFTRFESAARISDEDVPHGRNPHNGQS